MNYYSKEEAKIEIVKLVEDFKSKINVIKKGDAYKEANVEDEFIKPLFKYLNWNISNEGIKNIADREFIVQAKGKGGKEPDYLLQLEGKPCFYIEAKHPKYDLLKEIKYIWQAYSYAYSTQSSSMRKKVDFALLTDFEEFRFFDCTFKADPYTVNNFAVFNWKYTDYVDKFDLLWQYFENNNVKNDSLKALYINEKHIKENRIPPDKAFLDDLDNEKTGWRITLAKDIKKYNPELSSDFITSVIQLIIDRFVFIKVLSDREIEDDFLAQVIEQIDRASMKSEEGIINETCKDLFAKMNKTYNGSIFEERKELDIVKLSNKTLHSILKSLLPENSRYNFKVIPVEILGTIYEQFLGKIVSTTDKRATIEYKPEVRKAGGVYYTPQYIVEYIVENTLGTKLSNCKNINDVLKIKICDPACGSGSFLLGAYDKLITHIIHYFADKVHNNKDITKKEKELFYHDNDGNIRLTAKIKRDILQNCIFGVDIDPQAVEVTKMSLSLKALEYTRHDELYNEVDLFHEKVLPDLSKNIKCGNSLIGTDFFTPGLFADVEEMKKINAFDWDKEFKDIFTAEDEGNRGFDVVIGNPPYGAELLDKERKYLESKFNLKNTDTACLFMGLANIFLNQNGLNGFIVPKPFVYSSNWQIIRELLINDLTEIVDCEKVWKEVKLEQIIYIFEKNYSNNYYKSSIRNYDKIFPIGNIDKKTFIQFGFYLNGISEKELLIGEKILNASKFLNNFVFNQRGGMFQKLVSDKEKELKVIGGKQINRYIFNDDVKGFISKKNINDDKAYIKENSILVQNIVAHIINPQPHIKIISTLPKSFDFNNCIILDTVNQLNNISDYKQQYLIAILNSKLISWYVYLFIFGKAIRTMHFDNYVTSRIPYPNLDFSNPSDKQSHDLLVSLVDQMLEAQKEYHAKKDRTDEHTSKIMQQRIDSIDKQIDDLVYKLYGLTDDEINIVEGE